MKDVTVLIAFITSLASVFISIISFISVRNTNKSNQKTSLELETLKFELDHKKNKNSFAFDLIKKEIISLDKLISGIQEMKDRLNLIINCIENSLASTIAMDQINKSIQNLIEIYDLESPNLNDNALKFSHRAKNISMTSGYTINDMLKDSRYVMLDSAEKNKLNLIKDTLTEAQMFIRDAKYEIIVKNSI